MNLHDQSEANADGIAAEGREGHDSSMMAKRRKVDRAVLRSLIAEAVGGTRFSDARQPGSSLTTAEFAEVVKARRGVIPVSYSDAGIRRYEPLESSGKRELGEYLRSLSELDEYLDGSRQFITCDASYGVSISTGISISDATSRIMRGAAIHGIDSASDALYDFLATHSIPTKLIFLLTGPRVEDEMDLDPYCKLVPIDRVSHVLDAIADSPSSASWPRLASTLVGALVIDAAVTPGTWGRDESTRASVDFKGVVGECGSVGILCCLLSLASRKAISPLAQTQEFEYRLIDTLPTSAYTPLGGWSLVNSLVSIMRFDSQLRSDAVRDGVALGRQYADRSSDTQRRLWVPLSRYMASLARLDMGDRYIDLGTAYEALLLGRNTKKKTMRLAKRTSWICSGTLSSQSQVYKDTYAFYDTRSDIVHGEPKDGDPELYELADSNFVQCIRYIIKHGAPDWGTVS